MYLHWWISSYESYVRYYSRTICCISRRRCLDRFPITLSMGGFMMNIARELTDEDWESDRAKNIAVFTFSAIAITFSAIAITVFVFALPVFVFATTFSAIALAVTVFALPVTVFALPITVFALIVTVFAFADSKPLLFPVAYLHYRKRMKILQDKEGGELPMNLNHHLLRHRHHRLRLRPPRLRLRHHLRKGGNYR